MNPNDLINEYVYFSLPEKNDSVLFKLPKRVIGKIVGYDKSTNIITLLYNGEIFRQKHTTDFGGISGVPSKSISVN